MNSFVIAIIGVLILYLGYRKYSPKIEKWLEVDYNRPTPAVEMEDGVDFIPAKHWTILFGHHFASIAGAAPIIGPVVACMIWGWLPALIWVIFGGIFFGAVHDFSTLVLSTENKGSSITEIGESVLGKNIKIIFQIFVWLTLILIVAVFAAAAGKTLANTPEVVLPTFGLIPLAILIGILMYKFQFPVLPASILGVICLVGLIIGGYYIPITLPVASPQKWWTVILIIYGMIAAIMPVSVLLQPRDHLAGSVLFFGLFMGFIGIIWTRPVMKAPPITSIAEWKEWIWPMIFVTIACGAISGFHSLVASGTTSKQLPRMKDARPIGYGAMIMESSLSILAIIAVCAGLYWKGLPSGVKEGYVYQDLMKQGGWIKAFGTGYGELTRPIFKGLGYLIGITMLKTFIMTTLDSATRITRYITTELFGNTFGIGILKNRFFSTLRIGLLAGALALGNWRAIWPVFGASNQLIAAIVLSIITLYLIDKGRSYIFVLIPCIFMFLTTLGALIYEINSFLRPAIGKPNYLLTSIGCVLFLLGLLVGVYSVLRISNRIRQR